jgi:diguanylate cyclase (GGDEF)-like protein
MAASGEGRSTTGGSRVQSSWSLLLPYVPLVVAILVALPRVLGGRALGPFLTVNGIVLVVVVLVRQAMTAWELRDTVSALHEREAELARLALEDPLTGLANRARFSEQLERTVANATCRPAVVYIDLDGFKAVNDHYGHAVGDDLLTEVGARLTACCTDEMLLARVGGDEFVVLVESGSDEAIGLARRILESFAVPFQHEGERISFQASVGVATAPLGGVPEEAVRRADAAMYVAKSTGKGRAVGYPDELVLAAPPVT